MSLPGTSNLDCARARRYVDALLDGEAPDRRWLDAHLAGCTSCREMHDDMQAIQAGLSGLELPPMPDAVLDEVLDRTTRAPHTDRSKLRSWGSWAAAAMIVVTVGLAVMLRDTTPVPAQPTRAEMEQAAAEARIVLAMAGRAVGRAGRVATREVAGDVSAAFERIPVKLPGTHRGRRKC